MVTKCHDCLYVPKKKETGSVTPTNSVNPLFSEEAHFVETCSHILGADWWDKIEQIGAEAVEVGKGDQGKTLKVIDVSWRS